MKGLVTLVSFALALSLVSGATDTPKVIEARFGSKTDLEGEWMDGQVKICTIKTNEGEVFEIYPNKTIKEKLGRSKSSDRMCAFTLWNPDYNVAGVWTLTTSTDNDKIEKKFALNVIRLLDVKPAKDLMAAVGQSVTVWIDDTDNKVTACKLRETTGRTEYNLLDSESLEGFSRYRGCGVRMDVVEKMHSQWEIERRIGDYIIEKGSFNINLSGKVGDDERNTSYVFNLGQRARISIGRDDIVSCQLTRPDGFLTELKFGRCEHEISSVSKMHRGTWQASFAVVGKIELNHAYINVETRDLSSLNATQTSEANGEISLLCRTGVKSLQFCTFIRPDKYVVSLPVGVGNDNYSYYGDGYDEYDGKTRHYGDCGITIHKPSRVDFGLWTCEVGVRLHDRTVVRGTVINVVQNKADNSLTVEYSEVFVKRGDRFKIRCSVNALLDYCWLTSPNGTIYSVLFEASAGSALEYDGRGFAMGDCGAIVRSANATDDGEWTCHLGISGSREVEAKVPVKVTDSYLVPSEGITYKNRTAEISCRTFIEEEGTLKYCRWIRPDGNGINQEDEWRYETTAEFNKCKLSIKAIKPEDFGHWTCVALLSRAASMEQRATVEIVSSVIHTEPSTASIILIVIGTGLLVIALIGSLIAISCIFKRRKLDETIKSPPPYDPEDFVVPRAMSDDAREPTMDKDYKY